MMMITLKLKTMTLVMTMMKDVSGVDNGDDDAGFDDDDDDSGARR